MYYNLLILFYYNINKKKIGGRKSKSCLNCARLFYDHTQNHLLLLKSADIQF